MICPNCCFEIKSLNHDPKYLTTIYEYSCGSCCEKFVVWSQVRDGCQIFEHKEYRLHCDPRNNKCQIQKMYMEIESDTSIMYRWYDILELNAVPQGLTEENFPDKLRTMLIFS